MFTAELLLKQTTQAADVQLAFCVFVVLACLVWLRHIWWTQWPNACCGQAPRECRCDRPYDGPRRGAS